MRRLALVASVLAAFAAAPAQAATEAPYTAAAFQSAQQADAPILIWVHASWCPTCAKQAPILGELTKEPSHKDLRMFIVDFDSQKDVVRALGVQMQSTLIAYHGTKETGRSTGQTDAAAIRTILGKTAG